MSAASKLSEDTAKSKDILSTEAVCARCASAATDFAFERIDVAVPAGEETVMRRKALARGPIALLLVALMACNRTPQEEPFAEDPIGTVGHGMIFGRDGRALEPDGAFIERAQRFYITRLRGTANVGEEPAHIQKTIDDLVHDRVLAQALFVDWLINNVEPADDARLTMVNNALRWQYVRDLQRDPVLPEDGEWSKGIPKDVAKELERRSIQVFLKTNAAGRDYVAECRKNGVPVPDKMFSSDWESRGVVDGDFLTGPGSQAELWLFRSTSPAGVCLALPRYSVSADGTVSDDAKPFGVICLGTQTSKACFFDNPSGKTFKRNVEVWFSEWLGGTDLTNNGQGECTECHAGENPFIVHPDKAAFSGLTSSLMPLAWYDPLVDPNWPQNPGPTNLLDAISSPRRCPDCHQAGFAGRFPDVSAKLFGYCTSVLRVAMGRSPGATAQRTMPRPPGSDQTPYVAHIDALDNACKGAPPPPGVVVEYSAGHDDPGFVSPPMIIDPVYQCATKVAVRSAILDAKLTLFVNGTAAGIVVARNPDYEEFTVPALVVNDTVTAQQEVNGVTSAPSVPVTVRDHKLDYPGGLPAPEIDPSLIYECADVIAVRHIPGATVTLLVNGGFPFVGSSGGSWSNARPNKFPFVVGDTFTAQQSLCADTSPVSAAATAVAAPTTLPAPTFDPPQPYAGQQLVTIGTLVNGSHTHVAEASFGPLGEFTTPISWKPNYDVATPKGGPLSVGDKLLAHQVLCIQGQTATTPPAGDCSTLRAPRIDHPRVGDTFVVVTQAVPGARIRVYDGNNVEIGDGSGTVIVLKRAITGSDVLTVVQQVGECTSKTGYRVSVRNPG